MSNLQNLHILVTRPDPQGAELCQHIKAQGGTPIHFPTLVFHAIPVTRLSARFYDWIIFCSRPAVTHGLASLTNNLSNVAALGAGTAEALNNAGVQNVLYPANEWTTEGLLDLPVFQQVTNKKILLVRGEGGRETLAQTLVARGAIVEHRIVYRRELPHYSDLSVYRELFQQQKINIIVCTSGESLHNLITFKFAGLCAVKLIVVSKRLAAIAKQAGFQQVYLAENASHAAILHAIKGINDDR